MFLSTRPSKPRIILQAPRWLAALLPCRCYLCAAPLGRHFGICVGCRNDLPPPPTPHLTDRPIGIDEGVVGLRYAYPADTLVRALKFTHALQLAPALAERLLRRIPEGAPPDVVVPIPLSRRRHWQRGFNQAEEIAREVARAKQIPCRRLLRRVRHTAPQARLPIAERLTNLEHAFQCRTPLDGLDIALVDDVLTTGATLSAAAQALKSQGARRIRAWVVCQADPPDFGDTALPENPSMRYNLRLDNLRNR